MDEQDLNALYDDHARDLLGYLTRRSGDPQLALDRGDSEAQMQAVRAANGEISSTAESGG